MYNILKFFLFICPPGIHVAHNDRGKYEVDNGTCKRHVHHSDCLLIERNAAPASLCQFLAIVFEKIDLNI